jgi:hypothetical protein
VDFRLLFLLQPYYKCAQVCTPAQVSFIRTCLLCLTFCPRATGMEADREECATGEVENARTSTCASGVRADTVLCAHERVRMRLDQCHNHRCNDSNQRAGSSGFR